MRCVVLTWVWFDAVVSCYVALWCGLCGIVWCEARCDVVWCVVLTWVWFDAAVSCDVALSCCLLCGVNVV